MNKTCFFAQNLKKGFLLPFLEKISKKILKLTKLKIK